MLALALAAALSAAEVEEVATEHTPSVFIDFHPLSTTGAPLIGLAMRGAAFVDVPVTLTFAVSERTALTADLALSYFNLGSPGWTFTASLGPTFYFGSEKPLSGWFITPKLTFHVGEPTSEIRIFANGGNGPVDFGGRTATAWLGGFDFGYQWRLDKAHVALVSGLSAGYGYRTLPFITPMFVDSGSRAKWQGFVMSGNFDLLRLGVAL